MEVAGQDEPEWGVQLGITGDKRTSELLSVRVDNSRRPE